MYDKTDYLKSSLQCGINWAVPLNNTVVGYSTSDYVELLKKALQKIVELEGYVDSLVLEKQGINKALDELESILTRNK